jgi:protein-disulfide isomerase
MKNRLAIGAALAGAALLGAIAVGYSSAQSGNSGEFSKAEEEAIREIVRDYLIDHPDVLIEALNSYYEREQAAVNERSRAFARENLSALLDEAQSVSISPNPAAAKVAVVEFFDYHCGYCKRASGYVKELTKKDPAVNVMLRDFPILRRESDYAAEFVLASRTQGKYADLHFALMAENGVMTEDRIKKTAKKIGIDVSVVEAELQNPEIKRAIDETHRLAAGMGVEGTPTFVVASLNGEYVEIVHGNRQEDVAAAIAKAKKAAKE